MVKTVDKLALEHQHLSLSFIFKLPILFRTYAFQQPGRSLDGWMDVWITYFHAFSHNCQYHQNKVAAKYKCFTAILCCGPEYRSLTYKCASHLLLFSSHDIIFSQYLEQMPLTPAVLPNRPG